MSTVTTIKTAFELKASLFTLPILKLLNTELELIANQLQTTISKTPNFFNNLPVIIDLDYLNGSDDIDLIGIKNLLKANRLVPVAVRNPNEQQQQLAVDAGLGLMTATPQAEKKSEQNKTPLQAKIITGKVRSGQQHFAPHGDLIVLGSVSSGAELLADGNIHIYGSLGGRALAGINGNKKARVFCQHFSADLVAIAGQYKLFEEFTMKQGPYGVQIFINADEHLTISAI